MLLKDGLPSASKFSNISITSNIFYMRFRLPFTMPRRCCTVEQVRTQKGSCNCFLTTSVGPQGGQQGVHRAVHTGSVEEQIGTLTLLSKTREYGMQLAVSMPCSSSKLARPPTSIVFVIAAALLCSGPSESSSRGSEAAGKAGPPCQPLARPGEDNPLSSLASSRQRQCCRSE